MVYSSAPGCIEASSAHNSLDSAHKRLAEIEGTDGGEEAGIGL